MIINNYNNITQIMCFLGNTDSICIKHQFRVDILCQEIPKNLTRKTSPFFKFASLRLLAVTSVFRDMTSWNDFALLSSWQEKLYKLSPKANKLIYEIHLENILNSGVVLNLQNWSDQKCDTNYSLDEVSMTYHRVYLNKICFDENNRTIVWTRISTLTESIIICPGSTCRGSSEVIA